LILLDSGMRRKDKTAPMMMLEQLQPNAAIRGIVPDALVTVVSVQWFGWRR